MWRVANKGKPCISPRVETKRKVGAVGWVARAVVSSKIILYGSREGTVYREGKGNVVRVQ